MTRGECMRRLAARDYVLASITESLVMREWRGHAVPLNGVARCQEVHAPTLGAMYEALVEAVEGGESG